jgi:hypothetical protein
MTTWGVRRVVDLLRGLVRLYYRRKYGALARRMGRADVGPDSRRGLVVIQIDGLSYEHLREAMAADAMPHLSRMVAEGRMVLSSWRCGLPSTTPAVQAGIMFGSRHDIPGFRWYEKETGIAVVAKRPDQMRAVQQRVRGTREGLLAGGSSYVNMFDGDADLALFTLSALHPQRFFESVRGAGLLLLFLLSPFRVLRVIWCTLTGYAESLAWRVVALFRPSVLVPYDVIGPLLSSTIDALFAEVQTFGVALDVYRRVPVIYANYNTYDEAAHLLGPTHRSAFRALRDIDRRVRQIDRVRTRYRARTYDLYLLSDHGNTAAVPFSWRVGRSLGRFILDQMGEQLSLNEVFDRAGYSRVKARYLLEELRVVGEQLPSGPRRLVQALWRTVDRRVPPDLEVEAYDLKRWEDVVVRVSGPLAHIYFNVARRPLDLIELAVLYPRLLDRLLETDALGLVVGRAGLRTVALGPGGGTAVIGSHELTIEQPNPLACFGDPGRVAREVHRLAGYPHAGDLILLGAVHSDGHAITFEEQVATHGGLGGAQETSFLCAPAEVGPISVDGPEDLYRIFREMYG